MPVERGSASGAETCFQRRLQRRNRRWATGILVLVLFLQSCARKPAPEPVTLIYLDQRLVNPAFQAEYEEELRQFTAQTGIRVKALPHPESTQGQLALWQSLLRSGPSGPDVYGVDVVWPGILQDDLIDLTPYFTGRTAEFFPSILNSFKAGGKLVAVPEGADVGLLFYRKDLLEKYGYKHPPETWDELEAMAKRIQAGERAQGKRFWGFVWPGVETEALTCSALEWQSSQGGGRIIEENGTISVNNPKAIRAWERAARWVGTISPPTILAYNEFDASNAWYAGEAAFLRNWPTGFDEAEAPNSPFKGHVAMAPLPGGEGGRVGALGGIGLGVSRRSAHVPEAVQLVQFLTGREMARRRALRIGDAPSITALYDDPDVRLNKPRFQAVQQVIETGTVARPSAESGKKYNEVSVAYSHAVHSVLSHERTAQEAAASLESRLVAITGLPTGPPLEPAGHGSRALSPDKTRTGR